uniref:Uncharacterized protein n=1 Tax=Romanomermis culicivorax TaxID=13658 RepID=A0A915KL02_ROMCU
MISSAYLHGFMFCFSEFALSQDWQQTVRITTEKAIFPPNAAPLPQPSIQDILKNAKALQEQQRGMMPAEMAANFPSFDIFPQSPELFTNANRRQEFFSGPKGSDQSSPSQDQVKISFQQTLSKRCSKEHGVTKCCSYVTVGRFPENRSYPFRPKVDFQAERFKLLDVRSVPFRRKRQHQKTRRIKSNTQDVDESQISYMN